MRKIIFIGLALIATLPTFAQKTKKERKEERRQRINELIKQEEEGVLPITNIPHSASSCYRMDMVRSWKLAGPGHSKSIIIQLNISERKHPKKKSKRISPYLPLPLSLQDQIIFIL